MLQKIVSTIDSLNENTGKAAGWIGLALVLLVCIDVFSRYLLNISSVAVQELEWHLFALLFLLGAAYTLKRDDHVRVDIFYSKFNKKQQAWVNLIGLLIFFIPFAIIIIYSSTNFFVTSFNISEASPDPGGLPARYVLKAMLPLSFLFLFLQGISLFIKSILIIKSKNN